uniref:Uncharacterized protein n=1 Tax=Strombidium rassoulzadegani TaxID=1082188 RepID=A0A7S3FU98_9SPIT
MGRMGSGGCLPPLLPGQLVGELLAGELKLLYQLLIFEGVELVDLGFGVVDLVDDALELSLALASQEALAPFEHVLMGQLAREEGELVLDAQNVGEGERQLIVELELGVFNEVEYAAALGPLLGLIVCMGDWQAGEDLDYS